MTQARLNKITQTLKSKFHFKALRPGQEEVMESVLARHNTLTIMPTGGGKSLCYQLPALHLPGTTIIVSPLISLMKDQREKVIANGLVAIEFNSSVKAKQLDENFKKLLNEEAEFIYVTPERLTDPDFLKVLKKVKIDFVVIDEAHCVSQWGHDFRPSYLNLKNALKVLKSPPVLALTATATPAVIDDIQKQLGLTDLQIFRSGLRRQNLHLTSYLLDNEAAKQNKLLELVQAQKTGSGIIYASTIKGVEAVHELLEAAGIQSLKYHGKLSASEREAAQDEFMNCSPRLMVATNAFGMGIDKSDIRFVIHYTFPGTLEAYYQEAGRAGRDGQPAVCSLLFLRKDKSVQALFLSRKYPTLAELSAVYSRLSELGKVVTRDQLGARMANVPKRKLNLIVSFLKALDVVQEPNKGELKLHQTKLSLSALVGLAERYRVRAELDDEKLKRMISYAQTALCRWKALASYFGEDVSWDRCGHCDNCSHPVDLDSVAFSPAHV